MTAARLALRWWLALLVATGLGALGAAPAGAEIGAPVGAAAPSIAAFVAVFSTNAGWVVLLFAVSLVGGWLPAARAVARPVLVALLVLNAVLVGVVAGGLGSGEFGRFVHVPVEWAGFALAVAGSQTSTGGAVGAAAVSFAVLLLAAALEVFVA